MCNVLQSCFGASLHISNLNQSSIWKRGFQMLEYSITKLSKIYLWICNMVLIFCSFSFCRHQHGYHAFSYGKIFDQLYHPLRWNIKRSDPPIWPEVTLGLYAQHKERRYPSLYFSCSYDQKSSSNFPSGWDNDFHYHTKILNDMFRRPFWFFS